MPKNTKSSGAAAAKAESIAKVVKAMETGASTQAKKKKKKGKKSIWDVASKGLGIAGSLVPILAPLLLKDHSSKMLGAVKSVVGQAPVGVASPMSSNTAGLRSLTTKSGRGGMVESARAVGTEFLQNVVLPGDAKAGSILFQAQINPVAGIFNGTRLKSLAAEYQRWNVTPGGLLFRFASSLPTTFSGQIAMVIFSDPATQLADDGTDLIRQVTDAYGNDEAQAWSSAAAVSAPPVPNQPSLYVDMSNNDVALYSAGVLVMITLTDGTGTDVSLGSLFLDYDLEFYQPTVEPTSVEPIAYIFAGHGASSCTDTAPLGLAQVPVLFADTIGITDLTGAGFSLPGNGKYQIIWEITVATSVTNASTSIASVNGSMVFLAPNGVASSSAYLRYSLYNETPGTPRPLVFSLTGITGENVSYNRVHVLPHVDFPDFDAFSSRNPRIKLVNEKCRQWGEDAVAREKTNFILERVEQMLSRLPPAPVTPAPTVTSLPSLASLELGWRDLGKK